MKLPRGYRGALNGVCSKEISRYNLNQPHLDVDKKLLIATDGHALVCIPIIVEEGETSGPVPLKAIRLWMDGTKRNNKVYQVKKPVTLHCSERVKLQTFEGEEISYPRDKADVPKWEPLLVAPKGPPTMMINAEILMATQRAMNATAVSIWVTDLEKAIYICPESHGVGVAVLMPVRHGAKVAADYKTLKAE